MCRFSPLFPRLELIVGDIQTAEVEFSPVELIFVGLVLEYVDIAATLKRIRILLNGGGILGTVVQLPNPEIADITPSKFVSLRSLAPLMRLVRPEQLRNLAEQLDYCEISSWKVESRGGKQFQVQEFRLLTPKEVQPGRK